MGLGTHILHQRMAFAWYWGSERPKDVSAESFCRIMTETFCRNISVFLSSFCVSAESTYFCRNSLFLQKQLVSAEIASFLLVKHYSISHFLIIISFSVWQKQALSAETSSFCRNKLFLQKEVLSAETETETEYLLFSRAGFCFCVSVKFPFRSFTVWGH